MQENGSRDGQAAALSGLLDCSPNSVTGHLNRGPSWAETLRQKWCLATRTGLHHHQPSASWSLSILLFL